MSHPKTSDEISSAPPSPDPLRHVLRELRDSIAQISARLSAEGFGDFPDNGPVVLWGISSGSVSTADMAEVLEITEQEVHGTIETLLRNGYLAYRDVPDGREDVPDGRDGPRLTPTARAEKVGEAADAALRVARWADFPVRQGDIVIATLGKTGTTWLQSICAFLVFQSPEPPAPVSELSPWLEYIRTPRDEVYARLAAQEHRRIIKSHLSLNELPIDPRATYIVSGRHPLDVEFSMYNQNKTHQNQHRAHRETMEAKPGGEAEPGKAAEPDKAANRRRRGPVSPHEALLKLFDVEPSRPGRDNLAHMLEFFSAAWAWRDAPNVLLVRYEDLSGDLEGEMRRIAECLGIAVPDAVWPDLVKAATFGQMRAKADRFAPSELHLKEPSAFFRSGVSGRGRELLTDAELARYHARAAQLAPADLLAWLHRDLPACDSPDGTRPDDTPPR